MEGKALGIYSQLNQGPASRKEGKLGDKLGGHTSLLTFLRCKNWTFFSLENLK